MEWPSGVPFGTWPIALDADISPHVKRRLCKNSRVSLLQELFAKMGHVLFILLHLVALLTFPFGLIATVPLHIIYAAVQPNRPSSDPNVPRPETHRRCPECREFVRAEASRCKHCAIGLLPQQTGLTKAQRTHGDVGGFVLAVRDAARTEGTP